MRTLKTLAISLLLCIQGCSTTVIMPSKLAPEFDGVDHRAQKIVDEYMWLSDQNHIRFYNKVSIGFKSINKDRVVGYCHYGLAFREIDIDITYWNRSTYTTKMALLFHELTHCYCSRGHDFDKDKKYPNITNTALFDLNSLVMKLSGQEGFFEDGCPISLMYPEVIGDSCMQQHYDHYTKEMFERCKAW